MSVGSWRTQKIPVRYLSKECLARSPLEFTYYDTAAEDCHLHLFIVGGGHIETPEICAFNIHSIYLSIYIAVRDIIISYTMLLTPCILKCSS